jgi:hypothetical protein
MKPHLQEYIDEFNNGELDNLISIFSNMEQILTFFHKQKILHLIDPFDDELSDYQLEILNYLLNVLNDKEILEKCVAQLSDVIPKDGVYYLRVTDREDLSELFYNGGRDTTAKDVAKAVLGEDMWDSYGSTTDDVYRDVIEELTPENIEHLKKHLLDVLTDWKIEIDDETPDLFRNHADADDKGVFYLTPDNVGDVIGDEESFMYLIDNDYLPDFLGDLSNVHSNAYNSAYETETYNMVMGELETFFDMDSAKWESVALYNNPEKLTEFYYIKFNPNEVSNSIKKYVSERNLWGYGDFKFDYVGNWLGVITTLMEEGDESYLDFRIPDYPDSRLVDKYINELLLDYI